MCWVEPLRSELLKADIKLSFCNTPFGSVIAIADLIDCVEMTDEKIRTWQDIYGQEEIELGLFESGRYAWILTNVRRIEPVPAMGMQRLWEWEGMNVSPIMNRL